MAEEELPWRIRQALEEVPEWDERAMFGGIGFMLHGNMACGSHKGRLIVRVGPDAYEEALGQPHTRPFDLTGRPMKGWVMVLPKGYDAEEDLREWVQRGIDFALTLPPK